MRESGILMPVSSLPGPYGIGCFGKEAFKFVDFLAQAGQKIWQILPLSPTGYGDSPYQSCSAFAGNPYFIDLDALKEEGLLTAAQLKAEKWGTDPKEVDYGTLYVSRFKVLRTAYAAWRKQCAGLHGCSYYFPDDYYAFTLANEEWLDDYALYMALKVANGMKNWVEWDKLYRLRDKKALAAFAAEAAAQGKTLAYPVCGEAYSLTAAVPGPDGWEMGQYGIRTPILSRSEILLPEALDLVLVPCTAFDADCFRVGMGKGYYDRYLPRCKNAVKIGIAFEAQRVEHAAVDEHDQRLDAYVTERGIYKWK